LELGAECVTGWSATARNRGAAKATNKIAGHNENQAALLVRRCVECMATTR
jgi:hypothetical protein